MALLGGGAIHHQQLIKIPALSLFSSLLSNVSASMSNELMTTEHWQNNLYGKMDIQ